MEKISTTTIKGLPAEGKIQKVGEKKYVYFVYNFTVNGRQLQERDYIGVLSEDGTEFIPNKTYKLQGCYRKQERPLENWKNEQHRQSLQSAVTQEVKAVKFSAAENKEEAVEAINNDSFCSVGATALAAAILDKTAMAGDVAEVLGNHTDLVAVLNLAMHAAITSDPTYCAERESKVQKFIGRGCPASPRASELLQRLGMQSELGVRLARERAKHVQYGALLAIDGTELPSSSKNINLTALGKTKDGTFGTQINLSLLVDTQSGDAVCYHTYAGSTTDISTLDDHRTLWDSIGLKDKNITFTADRGYLSKDHAGEMVLAGYKFLFGAKTGVGYVKQLIDSRNYELYEPRTWISGEYCYGIKEKVEIKTAKGPTTLQTYLFRSTRKQEEEMDRLTEALQTFEAKWDKASDEDKQVMRKHELYSLYYETSGGLLKNAEAFNEACYLMGFFALCGNVDVSTRGAIELYRERNKVEVDFKLLMKNLLQSSRVHSTVAFHGLMFVTFIALNILTYLNRAMTATIPNSLSHKKVSRIKDLYTTRELFKDLQRIQLRKYGKGQYKLVNVLNRDRELAEALGFEGLFDDPKRVADLLSGVTLKKNFEH